jgi:uncharacterized protein
LSKDQNQSNSNPAGKNSLEGLLGHRNDLSPEILAELEQIIALEQKLDSEQNHEHRPVYFELSVSQDKMRLDMVLWPCKDVIERPKIEDVLDDINKLHISCPIDVEAIEKAMCPYPLEEKTITPVGHGLHPQPGKNGWIEFHVENPNETLLNPDANDRVNYREIHKIVDVKKDDALLTIHAPTTPIAGWDVYGHLLHANKGVPVNVISGKNTHKIKESNTIYADKTGYIIFEKNNISVEEMIVINGDVDMSIGNIRTPLRVLIHGNVLEGFCVESEESIVIDGNVEGAFVESRQGEVIIKGGYFGRKKSMVKAKKYIFCRFANYGILNCGGFIDIEDSLMNTTITCGERLNVYTGKHGLIVGGHIRIKDHIRAKTIGNASETRTDIYMGFDYAYESELNEYDLTRQSLNNELQEFNQQLLENSNAQRVQVKGSEAYNEIQKLDIEMRKKILLHKVEIEKVSKLISAIEEKAFGLNTSYVEVHQEIFPNIHFHMHEMKKRTSVLEKSFRAEFDPVKREIRTTGGQK